MKFLNQIITKKNNNNIILLKLGKIINNSFDNKINIHLFEKLLSNTKSNYHLKIDYKKYNIYHDDNNIYTIYDNGYEKHYSISKNTTSNIKLEQEYDIESQIIECRRLARDGFELKDKYDKVLFIQAISFNYDTYVIEFNKIIENDIEYNEINIIINNRNAKIQML